MDEEVKALMVVNLLLRALSMRILSVLTLVMTFALFCYAMWAATILTASVAGVFGLGVLWPVLYIGWKKGDS